MTVVLDLYPMTESPKIPEVKEYSPEFKQLLENDHDASLLRGSHVDTSFEQWENGRKFITEAISKDGSILDYGCANGFLLRSLQEWSDHTLEPYGVDTDQQAIDAARDLFHGKQNHFAALDKPEEAKDFPKEFDYIYWNVWDNYHFDGTNQSKLFDQLKSKISPEGKLILGFYQSTVENQTKLGELEKLGLIPNSVIKNPTGNEELAIFTKAKK